MKPGIRDCAIREIGCIVCRERGLGYVPCTGEPAEALLAASYEIDVAGRRVAAEASLKPLYDPENLKPRS